MESAPGWTSKVVGLRRLIVAGSHDVFIGLMAERADADAEFPRRGSPVALAGIEEVEDVPLFQCCRRKLGERAGGGVRRGVGFLVHPPRDRRRNGLNSRCRDLSQPQMRSLEFFAVTTHDDAPFHDILQLPDVSWPQTSLPSLGAARGKAGHPHSMLADEPIHE